METKMQASRSTAETDIGISTLVVNAVSAATEKSLDELPPLYDTIDPDALETLFGTRGTDCCVKFQYAGNTVTIYADRTINISPNN